jgi:hypothetical protein
MDVLTAMEPLARFTDENLFCLVIGRMANLSLEHGNGDASCLAYALLGAVLARNSATTRRRTASASSV